MLAYEHLSIYHILHGDKAAPDANMTKANTRGDELAFPWGPYNHAYASHIEIWLRRECGEFDRARQLVIDMVSSAERYGIDFWHTLGATLGNATVEADIALHADDIDPDQLSTHIEQLTQFTDFWRSLGLYAYQTQYDCVVAQLLIAAGRPAEARTGSTRHCRSPPTPTCTSSTPNSSDRAENTPRNRFSGRRSRRRRAPGPSPGRTVIPTAGPPR